MLKTFFVNNNDVEDHLYPMLYRFKKKLKELSYRKDVKSFSLGDKNIIEILTDGEHAGQVFLKSGAKFIKNGSVKRFGISEYDGFYISEKKNELLKRSQLELHDVLFTTIGKYLGVSAVVSKNLVGANINQNVVRLRANPNVVSPQYLSCFLNSKLAMYQIDSLFTGNTHPILTYPKIKSLRIFIKDKLTHDKITENILQAEKLSLEGLKKIDKAKNVLLDSFNIDFSTIADKHHYEILQSEYLSNDIMTPEYYRPLYVNTIEHIKSKFNYKLLCQVADFYSGDEVGSNNYKIFLNRDESDIPFIRTTDIFNYEIDRYPDFFIENEIYQEINQCVNKEDILFTKDGKIGLTAMVTDSDHCILGSGVLRIVAKPHKIDPYYLFIILSTEQVGLYQAKQRTVIASTLPHLRTDRISDFIVPIVEDEDQKEIISLTKDGFALKEQSKILIDQTRLLLEKSLELA